MGKRKKPGGRGARESKPSILGARVREIRDKRGWNQPELGWRASIYGANISHIEHDGKGDLYGATIKRLAIALGVSTDYLFGLTDDPTPPRK